MLVAYKFHRREEVKPRYSDYGILVALLLLVVGIAIGVVFALLLGAKGSTGAAGVNSSGDTTTQFVVGGGVVPITSNAVQIKDSASTTLVLPDLSTWQASLLTVSFSRNVIGFPFSVTTFGYQYQSFCVDSTNTYIYASAVNIPVNAYYVLRFNLLTYEVDTGWGVLSLNDEVLALSFLTNDELLIGGAFNTINDTTAVYGAVLNVTSFVIKPFTGVATPIIQFLVDKNTTEIYCVCQSSMVLRLNTTYGYDETWYTSPVWSITKYEQSLYIADCCTLRLISAADCTVVQTLITVNRTATTCGATLITGEAADLYWYAMPCYNVETSDFNDGFLAKVNLTTNTFVWITFTQIPGSPSLINAWKTSALVYDATNKVIWLGDGFSVIGDAQRNLIAAVNVTNGEVSSFNAYLNDANTDITFWLPRVATIAIVNNILYVGGQFNTLGTVSSNTVENIASFAISAKVNTYSSLQTIGTTAVTSLELNVPVVQFSRLSSTEWQVTV